MGREGWIIPISNPIPPLLGEHLAEKERQRKLKEEEMERMKDRPKRKRKARAKKETMVTANTPGDAIRTVIQVG